MRTYNKKGFTLIELLIVIAIIAILAAIIFVALDPVKRFQDSRDSVRWQEASEMMTGIYLDQIDNGGLFHSEISTMAENKVYMIGQGNTGCDANNPNCDVNVSDGIYCVDLTFLANEGYLGEVPVSPKGEEIWNASYTGYTLEKRDTGTLILRACESENSDAIEVIR